MNYDKKRDKDEYQAALIICTRNNAQKLEYTLSHLAKVIPQTIQVVVVDQSTKTTPLNLPKGLRITHIRTPEEKGLSRARNTAIRCTTAPVLAWTDDDCIVTESYVKQLLSIMSNNHLQQEGIAVISGRTLPYFPTRPSPDYHCPCTFTKANNAQIDTVKQHWKDIGLGNNMIIFRKTFEEIGLFKEWLGVGAIGESGEDGDFLIRCIIKNKIVMHNDQLVVHHNKWLNDIDLRKQNWKYTCGGIASYGYHALKGVDMCRAEVLQNFQDSGNAIKSYLHHAFKYPPSFPHYMSEICQEVFYCIKGSFLAFTYAIFISGFRKEAVLGKQTKW